MALVLMHSVKWSKAHLGFHPVAEHKTHRFEYALYPHAGDWREGRVPWAAYEYNNRLLAVQADAGDGPLPAEMSFATIDGDAIVTALKPAGYPLAAHEKLPRGRLDRIVARMYEPTGFRAPVSLGWFAGMTSAERTNLLEEAEATLTLRDATASVNLSPFRIETVALNVKPPRTLLGDEDLGRRIRGGPARLLRALGAQHARRAPRWRADRDQPPR